MKMKNLAQNLVFAMTLEIIALTIAPALNINLINYCKIWIVFVFAITILSIILLVKFKPKYYLLLLLAQISILVIPLVFVYFILNRLHS